MEEEWDEDEAVVEAEAEEAEKEEEEETEEEEAEAKAVLLSVGAQKKEHIQHMPTATAHMGHVQHTPTRSARLRLGAQGAGTYHRSTSATKESSWEIEHGNVYGRDSSPTATYAGDDAKSNTDSLKCTRQCTSPRGGGGGDAILQSSRGSWAGSSVCSSDFMNVFSY